MKRRLEHRGKICRWRENLKGNQLVSALALNFKTSDDIKFHYVSLLYDALATTGEKSQNPLLWDFKSNASSWILWLLSSPVSLPCRSRKLVFSLYFPHVIWDQEMATPSAHCLSPSGGRRQTLAFVWPPKAQCPFVIQCAQKPTWWRHLGYGYLKFEHLHVFHLWFIDDPVRAILPCRNL